MLETSVSTYYARKTRPPSRRALSDAVMIERIRQTWSRHYSSFGSRRTWLKLRENEVEVGRDQVRRLMREHGLQGVIRGRKKPHTTISDEHALRPADLVERRFHADRPNRLWVCDLTYCWTLEGTCYAAFVVDVYSRRIVGWQLASTMRTELVLDALEMALHQRGIRTTTGLVHHSDAGSQYTSISYTDRLAELDVAASIGSVGDAYDNALAEAVINTYKHELVRNPHAIPNGKRWRPLDQLTLATTAWVGWYNHERCHSALDDLPPARFEEININTDNTPTLSAR